MCTSEKTLKTHLLGNLAGTVFLALFGAVYEMFSHGVYSYWMLYAFAIPLMLGVIPYTVLLIRRKFPQRTFLRLWSAAIAAFSVGCAFQGALEIYDTTNRLAIIYPIAGGLLLTAALASILLNSRDEQTQKNTPCRDTVR